jgi:hypothetical protein
MDANERPFQQKERQLLSAFARVQDRQVVSLEKLKKELKGGH